MVRLSFAILALTIGAAHAAGPLLDGSCDGGPASIFLPVSIYDWKCPGEKITIAKLGSLRQPPMSVIGKADALGLAVDGNAGARAFTLSGAGKTAVRVSPEAPPASALSVATPVDMASGRANPVSARALKPLNETSLDKRIEAAFSSAETLLDGPAGFAEPDPSGDRADGPSNEATRGARTDGDRVGDTGRRDQDPPPGPRVIRIYDASQGTSMDPLLKRNWDLNSVKEIPGPAGEFNKAIESGDRRKPGARSSASAAKPQPARKERATLPRASVE